MEHLYSTEGVNKGFYSFRGGRKGTVVSDCRHVQLRRFQKHEISVGMRDTYKIALGKYHWDRSAKQLFDIA